MIKDLIEKLKGTDPEIIFDMDTKELRIGDQTLDFSNLKQAKLIAEKLGVKTILTVRMMKNYINIDGTPRGYKGNKKRSVEE
tara:strand:+ start:72 stop:317 length:246 start_codon:yes stop_codon:yes gene_type:complete